MAHKKAGGSTKNGRDSQAQRRGVKVFGGTLVKPGAIIIRQVGSSFHAGEHVRTGRDFTLYSVAHGKVQFHQGRGQRRFVSVIPV
jgi:large subunit ribosomal protein L27